MPLFWEYCFLNLCFSLISTIVSSEMGLLSDRTLLDFEMALSTAVLIADTIRQHLLSDQLNSYFW